MTNERTYVAFASDGDQTEDVSRQEALEWAERHLSMIESLGPEGKDHWVQISSYSFEGADTHDYRQVLSELKL